MTDGWGAGVVLYPQRETIDAIEEYSRRLVSALAECGLDARYVAGDLSTVLRLSQPPSWVLLQYNPFRYGRSGFAPRLLQDARRLSRRSRSDLVVMVHEAWVDMTDLRTTLVGVWQRVQLHDLLRFADAVMTSTQALSQAIDDNVVHVPVATNITPVPTSFQAARAELSLDDKLVVSLFGRGHPSRALDYAEAAIAALVETHGSEALAVLNLGAGAPSISTPASVEIRQPGQLEPEPLSLHLRATELMLLPFTDGVSTRRTTLMAAMAHETPVLGLLGRNTDAVLAAATDAIELTPAGDPVAYAHAAVELTRDRQRLRAVGQAGGRLYRAQFDWPVVARRVASVLDTTVRNRKDAQ